MVNINPRNFEHDGSQDSPVTATTSSQPATDRQWSPYQQAIFDFVQSGRGSAVVIAVAGSGKTTTIVEAAKFLSPALSCSFVAFNKSIADELKTRLPGHVRAQTLNSLGYGAWRRHIGNSAANSIRLDANKTRQLAQDLIPSRDYGLYGKSMPRLIGIAKAIGLVPNTMDSDQYDGLVEDSDDVWVGIVETFGLDFDLEMDNPEHVALLAGYARKILAQSIQIADRLIDFDDQLYMPVITNARFWQNDFMFVDEAQDLNHVQRIMVRRALKPSGRLIAVGDPNQAIYGFRGAASDSIEHIKADFNAQELPLTISYRCPQAVVAEAQQFVSHIQASATAAVGTVTRHGKFDALFFQPTDAIVCRTTRPLIEMAFKVIRDGVACKVRGRDIGAGLITLIKRFKTNDLAEFQAKLAAYVSRKFDAYMTSGKEDLATRLQDQSDTIQIFVDQVDGNPAATVADVIAKIEGLFSDNGPQILTLSTIHKAKGLEFDRVFILDSTDGQSKWARTPEQKQQEANLQYVAITRAKMDLGYISSKQYKEGQAKGGR